MDDAISEADDRGPAPTEISLADKLAAVRADLRDEYLQAHTRPWIVGFSGGKDSTLTLQLVMETLLELPPSKRTRTVHVLSNDTLVESPVVQAFVDAVLDRIGASVPGLRLPVVVMKTTPDPNNTFWVNLMGRGYPAPNRLFRWCTDRMKIRPTTKYIRDQVSAASEVILLLGVRRAESSARAKSARKYDNGERLNPHNDVKGCLVYRPIVELDNEEVWTSLLQLRPPWGGTHRDLVTLYRNGQGGECPFVVDSEDTPSCGTASVRFGCWTCTVVEKDKSLHGFIDNGFEHLEPLADFRDRLRELSQPNSPHRMTQRRNGQDGNGPFTLDARRMLLSELLAIQADMPFTLISEAEVTRIKELWADDQSLFAVNKANRLLSILGEA